MELEQLGLTAAGRQLLQEAEALLAQAESAAGRVRAAAERDERKG